MDCSAVFFTSDSPPAHGSEDPLRVAVACPAALLPLTVGPAGPAWPVTFLGDSRSCSCRTLEIVQFRYKQVKINYTSIHLHWLPVRTRHPWFIPLEVLTAQAFKQVATHADALSIQESKGPSVVTRPALAHVVLGNIVRGSLFQVGYPGVCTWDVGWN